MNKNKITDEFIEEVLYTNEDIVEACKKIGEQITKDYSNKTPILIGLLKGSIPFMAELMKHVGCLMETEYMHVSSYHGVHSTGVVTVLKDVTRNLEGRHIILVEDIVDSGLTLKEVINLLKDRKAANIEIATLFDKPSGRKTSNLEPKYKGFLVPGKFIVGFGLDYNELYRNLDYVGVLKKSVYSK